MHLNPHAADPAFTLGERYERWLDHESAGGNARKVRGSYYTPRALVESLVAATLAPLLSKLATVANPEQVLLQWAVCDPACGSGRFLVVAAQNLATRLALIRGREVASLADLCDIIEHCIYGVDIDPTAVELCRFALSQEVAGDPRVSKLIEQRIVVGDSLFEDVHRGQMFDAVIGNPPFVNMIDGPLTKSYKCRLREVALDLDGTADLAYYFVALAHQRTRADGVIGFVLPKSFLNAPSATRLRERLARERRPSRIAMGDDGQFRGADTYVAAVTLGGDEPCVVDIAGQQRTLAWPNDPAASNWWRVVSANQSIVHSGFTLADQFELTAGMTTGEAYEIREHLTDSEQGRGVRLITSRLIDPGQCRWGVTRCRYLGRNLSYPRLVDHESYSSGLRRRLQLVGRPKVLIAGLCNRGEAYLDAAGRDLGAVSTFVVYHPRDDRAALGQLAEWFNSAEIAGWLRDELGAASVGHGYMTLKKRTLQQLPLPERWQAAAA